ncbi:MAG TPA: tripartite tricarboxylate transporter TctB family protein [Burkholderiales bacterium]|nr:tripartite tricarboxylate transporter TctB family protein [Burkholderiales bacterium]
MSIAMLVFFGVMVGVATQYPPQARFMPLVVGVPALLLCLVQVVLEFKSRRRAAAESTVAPDAATTGETAGETSRRERVLWGSFLALVAGTVLFGFWATIPVFIAAFLRVVGRESWGFSLALAAVGTGVLVAVFRFGLGVILHNGFVLGPLLDRLSGS